MGIMWEASGRYLGRIWKASQILEGISKAPDLFNASTKNERPLEASGRSGTEHMGDILEGTRVQTMSVDFRTSLHKTIHEFASNWGWIWAGKQTQN